MFLRAGQLLLKQQLQHSEPSPIHVVQNKAFIFEDIILANCTLGSWICVLPLFPQKDNISNTFSDILHNCLSTSSLGEAKFRCLFTFWSPKVDLYLSKVGVINYI